jgi:hypothetical protein
MAGDDEESAKIESLKNAISQAQSKADAGDKMFLVRANYLRGQLAAITSPQTQSAPIPAIPTTAKPTTSPPKHAPLSVKLDALNRITEEPKTKIATQPEQQNYQQNFLEDYVQVTDMCTTPGHMSESGPQTHAATAGASPHAPDRQRREGIKDDALKIRLPALVKAALRNKAAALGFSSASAYALEIIAADLLIPIPAVDTARHSDQKAAFAELLLSWNKIGGLLNQIAAALNRGQEVPFRRAELEDLRMAHRDMIIKTASRLRFD